MNRYSAQALGLSLAAATLVAAAQSASAQPDEPSTAVRVSFADLDISHPAGAHVLLERIERAAVTACGGEPWARLQAQSSAYQQCRGDAISEAISHINAPMLTAAAKLDSRPERVASH
jgi:UrcA family protein